MRGSSLTTFLMFLPLIAIPLLAIFGVPEFTPVNASTPTDAGGNAIAIDDPVRKPHPGSSGVGDLNGTSDVFSPADSGKNVAPSFPGQGLKPESDPFLSKPRTGDDSRKSGKQGLQGWEIDQDRRPDKRAGNRIETPIQDDRSHLSAGPLDASGPAHPSRAGTTRTAALQSVDSMPESTPPTYTWRTAVRTLNRMGIREFLLQPGSRSEEFHFSCVYASPDNPRIAHRFEAEDADPLRAVQKVLQQIQSRQ